jgi:hypothetical protein
VGAAAAAATRVAIAARWQQAVYVVTNDGGLRPIAVGVVDASGVTADGVTSVTWHRAVVVDTNVGGLGHAVVGAVGVVDGITHACDDAGWWPVAGIRK